MPSARTSPLPAELQRLLTGASVVDVPDDQGWILALMRRQGIASVGMLWRMLGREQDVLDAYQAAVCSLVARGREGVGRNPDGYFYRTVLNAGVELLRKRRQDRAHWPELAEARRRRQDEVASVEGTVGQRQLIDRMRTAIFALPPHLRSVIILRDLGELPYKQVARILGITNGSARLYRRQAVLRLADLLGREAET